MRKSEVFASVIIPVLNDVDRLRLCLAALDSQTYPKERFEVIVVDNGSAVDPRDALPVNAPPTQVFVLREEQPGSYAARNRGIAMAHGEVLAFTDADCVPRPDWIEHGIATLQRLSAAAIVAGHIDLTVKDAHAHRFRQFSPRTWGWSDDPDRGASPLGVFPTHVGMVRQRFRRFTGIPRFPHARGDGPARGSFA